MTRYYSITMRTISILTLLAFVFTQSGISYACSEKMGTVPNKPSDRGGGCPHFFYLRSQQAAGNAVGDEIANSIGAPKRTAARAEGENRTTGPIFFSTGETGTNITGEARANASSQQEPAQVGTELPDIAYDEVLSGLEDKASKIEDRTLTALLSCLKEIVDHYIKKRTGESQGYPIKEKIDSILKMLSEAEEARLREVFLDASLEKRANSLFRAIEGRFPFSTLYHGLESIDDLLVTKIGSEQGQEELIRRKELEKTQECQYLLEELRNANPENADLDPEEDNIFQLGLVKYNTPEVKEELLRWYNKTSVPLLKIYAWWALYRIGVEVEIPRLTVEDSVGCSLEHFQPPIAKEVYKMGGVILHDEDSSNVVDSISTRCPWLLPVYLVKVKTEAVESLLSEELRAKKQEILDKLSYQVVSGEDAVTLSEMGREIMIMFVPTSFVHGRQVFWVDRYGNGYGLKGVGDVIAALRSITPTWKKPENSRNEGTGLAEVDSEDAANYTMELRRSSLALKEAGIGNSEVVAAVRYLELWDARTKKFLGATKFDWSVPVVDETGKSELDESGKPRMVKFVPGIHLIYYQKEMRRLGEYVNQRDNPAYQDFIRLSIARRFGLSFPDNKAYAKLLAYRVGENLAKLINLGKTHYYLTPHNILVDGSFVDMESMQSLDEVSTEEAKKLVYRDIDYADRTTVSLLKNIFNSKKFLNANFYNGLNNNLNRDRRDLLGDFHYATILASYVLTASEDTNSNAGLELFAGAAAGEASAGGAGVANMAGHATAAKAVVAAGVVMTVAALARKNAIKDAMETAGYTQLKDAIDVFALVILATMSHKKALVMYSDDSGMKSAISMLRGIGFKIGNIDKEPIEADLTNEQIKLILQEKKQIPVYDVILVRRGGKYILTGPAIEPQSFELSQKRILRDKIVELCM